MHLNQQSVEELNKLVAPLNAQEIVNFFNQNWNEEIVFGSSLGAEDQVITHLIYNSEKKCQIFTLDTGRIFPETYNLLDSTVKKYKLQIHVYSPDSSELEAMVLNHGINLFYESVENRKLCCQIRKLNPLKRAIEGKNAWFTGLRRSQSITRTEMQKVEWDALNQSIKINPLIDWTEADVWNYIKTHKIPYNTLHDQGFPSIGCQPCTRAIIEGEDVRAGRWWWENPDTRECGLHKK
jgi:phosphoadenosine phosphosulfate reductase